MARDVLMYRKHREGRQDRSYGGRSSVGQSAFTCFDKDTGSNSLGVKPRGRRFESCRPPFRGTVKPPEAPLSPERDRKFLHAPGPRPGCMADIAQRSERVRSFGSCAPAEVQILLSAFREDTRQDSFLRFWTVLIFIHAPGSCPGCMRESFEQAPAISTTPESGGGTRSPSLPAQAGFAKATPGNSKAR